MTYHRISNNF